MSLAGDLSFRYKVFLHIVIMLGSKPGRDSRVHAHVKLSRFLSVVRLDLCIFCQKAPKVL